MAAGEHLREMLSSLESDSSIRLSPVERLLLSTDGTVTHALEALTRSPVEVDILDRTVEDGNVTRKVVLRKGPGGDSLAWAVALVGTDALPEEVARPLVEGDVGIGHLLREQGPETRRRIVAMGSVWEDSPDRPDFITDDAVLHLRRTYEVYVDGRMAMTIEEYFPKGLY